MNLIILNIVKKGLRKLCRSSRFSSTILRYVPRKNLVERRSSNYADWVRILRIVLIAAQKAYVLNAPLGVLNLSVVCRCCETSDIHVLITT